MKTTIRKAGPSWVGGLALAACLFVGPVTAAVHTVTATVAFVRTHKATYGSHVDWFALSGVTSLGSCGVSEGLVVFRILDDEKGDRFYATVLNAKRAGSNLRVHVDDSVRDAGGHCIVSYMDLL
jgi:hypothetical protein